jgi:hypothetical protein
VVCDGDVCWAPNSPQPAKRDYAALVRCAALSLSVIRDECITIIVTYILFLPIYIKNGKGRLLTQHTAAIHRREQDNAIDATMVEHFTCQFVAFVSLMWAEYLGTDWDRTDEMVRANALRKEMFCPANKDGDAIKPSASAPNVEAVAGTCAARGRPRGWINDVTYCMSYWSGVRLHHFCAAAGPLRAFTDRDAEELGRVPALLVMFHAHYCGSCRALQPQFAMAAQVCTTGLACSARSAP